MFPAMVNAGSGSVLVDNPNPGFWEDFGPVNVVSFPNQKSTGIASMDTNGTFIMVDLPRRFRPAPSRGPDRHLTLRPRGFTPGGFIDALS